MATSDLGDVWIKGGHHLVHRLDHRHFTTERGVHIGEFKADVTAADDGNPTGKPLEVDGFIAGEDRASIGLNAGWNEGIGTCGQDHVLGGDHPVDTTGFPQSDPL